MSLFPHAGLSSHHLCVNSDTLCVKFMHLADAFIHTVFVVSVCVANAMFCHFRFRNTSTQFTHLTILPEFVDGTISLAIRSRPAIT